MHKLPLLLLLIFACTVPATLADMCNKMLDRLADEQSHFILCSTRHAVPVANERFCVSCKTENDAMTQKFNDLMRNCSKEYTDKDRMNIVLTTHSLLKELWNKAYCDNCFINNKETLQNFTQLEQELTECLGNHTKTECTSCMLQYINMNDFYKDLDKNNNGKICFDMDDIMNRTRVHWSNELKCCKREVRIQYFLISVAVVAVLPIVFFYCGAIWLTKRREANHGLLNHEEPALDTSPSTSQLITAAVLATPSERSMVIDAKTEKIAQLLANANELDSSDDDELPALKPKTN